MEEPELPESLMKVIRQDANNGDKTLQLFLKRIGDGKQWKNKALKLLQAIYGLRQSAQVWHEKFKDVLQRLQFQQGDSDLACSERARILDGFLY
eukprot:IDg7854t1